MSLSEPSKACLECSGRFTSKRGGEGAWSSGPGSCAARQQAPRPCRTPEAVESHLSATSLLPTCSSNGGRQWQHPRQQHPLRQPLHPASLGRALDPHHQHVGQGLADGPVLVLESIWPVYNPHTPPGMGSSSGTDERGSAARVLPSLARTLRRAASRGRGHCTGSGTLEHTDSEGCLKPDSNWKPAKPPALLKRQCLWVGVVPSITLNSAGRGWAGDLLWVSEKVGFEAETCLYIKVHIL